MSLIFPVYNKALLLDKALKTLAGIDAGVPYEVIIIDDASTEDMKGVYSSPIIDQLIINKKHNGNSTINVNKGVSLAQGKYIQYQNSDVWFCQKDWLKKIIKAFDKNTGVVGCKTIWEDGRVNHSIKKFTNIQEESHLERGIRLEKSSRGIKECEMVSGCGLTTTKKIFKKLGGFTPYKPFGWDDVDYCLKCKKEGYKVKCQCDAYFVHLGSRSYGGKETKEYYKNLLTIKQKYK